MALLDLGPLRAIADSVRQIAADIRVTRVTVRTRVWSGGEAGVGTATDTDLLLAQYIAVRKIKPKEVMTSGGFFPFDTLVVGPISPPYAGGGYTVTQVAPAASNAIPKSTEYIYVLSGAIVGNYRFFWIDESNPLHYTIYLHRIAVTASSRIL